MTLIFFLWKCTVSVLLYLPKDQFLFINQRLDLKTSPLLLTLSWCHNTFWKERELKANTVILILSHMQGRYSESYTWCNPLFWPATKPHFNMSYCTCHFWIGYTNSYSGFWSCSSSNNLRIGDGFQFINLL